MSYLAKYSLRAYSRRYPDSLRAQAASWRLTGSLKRNEEIKRRSELFDVGRGIIFAELCSVLDKRPSARARLNDLLQNGFLCLTRATRNYRHTSEVSFAQYFRAAIRNVFNRVLADVSGGMMLGQKMQTSIWRVDTYCREYHAKFGKWPTDSEIRQKFDLTARQLRERVQASVIAGPASIEQGLFAVLGQNRTPSPFDSVSAAELLVLAMNELTPRQREFFELHLQGYDSIEISRICGGSGQNVRKSLQTSRNKIAALYAGIKAEIDGI
ncbi:sigma-70 family RNA polymerase sigma factor [Candidatus Margulisiibacteriota bacterium]